MVAGASGYESVVEVHLDTVAITSSLNDIRLVSAESCRVRSVFDLTRGRVLIICVFLKTDTG